MDKGQTFYYEIDKSELPIDFKRILIEDIPVEERKEKYNSDSVVAICEATPEQKKEWGLE